MSQNDQNEKNVQVEGEGKIANFKCPENMSKIFTHSTRIYEILVSSTILINTEKYK